MAGDWIKVECGTPHKTEISVISRRCNCSKADAFLAWFKLWCYFDANCSDGFIRDFSDSDADEIGNLAGIASALEYVGWIKWSDTGCQIINWEYHNGASAKRRALENARKKASKMAPFRKMSASNAD
jgi:hypothetical protein